MIRNYHTYLDKISVKSDATQRGFIFANKNFTDLVDFVDFLKESDDDKFELLQHSINKTNLNPPSITTAFSHLTEFFYYMGFKYTPQDVKNNLNFPRKINEEKIPLTLEVLQKILEASPYYLKGQILTLLSSGMRGGELIQIRKKDLDLTHERIAIKIPASATKTRTGRTVFVSREVDQFIKIRELEDDDLVFTDNPNPYVARRTLNQAWNRVLKKIGLDQKYDSSNIRKYTPHSLRAYFFTKAVRIHDENYAHKMTGHKGYLLQYDRLTDEEKLEMYLTLEPHLLVYDLSIKNETIKTLRVSRQEFEDQKQDLDFIKKMLSLRNR